METKCGNKVHNDNELNNWLETRDIINNVFRPHENFRENQNKIIKYISICSFVIR